MARSLKQSIQQYKIGNKLVTYHGCLWVIDMTTGEMITDVIAEKFNIYCSKKNNYINESRAVRYLQHFIDYLRDSENAVVIKYV